MIDKNDWRRRGQEKYLLNAKLYDISFAPLSKTWDHEHCEFCWEKFGNNDGDLKEGYCTTQKNEKDSIWICKQCFEDFKDEFMLKVVL